jgi:hypothetical protein
VSEVHALRRAAASRCQGIDTAKPCALHFLQIVGYHLLLSVNCTYIGLPLSVCVSSPISTQMLRCTRWEIRLLVT